MKYKDLVDPKTSLRGATFSKHFDHWVKRNYASILASLSIHFKVITSFIGSARLRGVFHPTFHMAILVLFRSLTRHLV